MRFVSRLAVLFAVAVSVLSCGDTTDPVIRPPTEGIRIDGTLDPGEWDDAHEVRFEINLPHDSTGPGILYMTNDSHRLYVAARFDHADEFERVYLVVMFDNDNDGVSERESHLAPCEEGDDYISLAWFGGARTEFFDGFMTLRTNDPRGAVGMSDVADPFGSGTNDGAAAARVTGGYAVFEGWHPLNSADDPHDFSLQAGQTVGFSFYVQAWTTQNDLTQTAIHDDWSFFQYTVR